MQRRRKLSRRIRRRTRRYARGSNLRFSKRVKRVMYSNAEPKQVSLTWSGTSAALFNYTTMYPDVVQGTGDNQRIGNQIMGRKLYARGLFAFRTLANYDQSSYQIRIYIVFPRTLSASDSVSLITAANFPFQGLPDQDNFIYWYDKTFRLGTGAYGEPRQMVWNFAKTFNHKIYFTAYNNITAKKNPFIIIASNYAATNKTHDFNVYVRWGYKDI